MVRAEYGRQVIGREPVDGEAERVNALQLSFGNRLAGVFQTVSAFINILIVGFAVR